MTTPTVIQQVPEGKRLGLETGLQVVAGSADYIAFCRETLEQGPPERLLATGPYARRVKAFLGLYGQLATDEPYSPARELCRMLDVPEAGWLTDADLEGFLFEELPKKAVEGSSLAEVLLNTFLEPVFGERVFKGAKAGVISAVVGKAVSDGMFRDHPALDKAWQEKCKEWQDHHPSSWTGKLLPLLQQDPESVWQGLTSARLLVGYPGLLEFEVAPKVLQAIRSVPLEALDSFPLHGGAREGAVGHIGSWFLERAPKVKEPRHLVELLDSVSGLLEEEIKAFLQLIEAGKLSPTREVCEKAAKVFRSLPDRARPLLRELERKVAPPEPKTDLDSSQFGAREWIDWSLDGYFRYRHWQESSESRNDPLEAMVRSFSEWYLENYSEIQGHKKWGLPYQIADWMEELERDDVSLILLIDGLPGTFMEGVLSLARECGFYLAQREHRFAPLPSVTEVSKPLLFSGDWGERSSNYLSVLRKRFAAEGVTRPVEYFPNLQALQGASALPKGTLAILNYLAVDECLHDDLASHGVEHTDAVNLRIKSLFEALASVLAKAGGDSDRKRIYLCTDHGATRPIEAELTDWESSVMRSVFPDEKYRFGTLEAGTESLIPDNLWQIGHRFKCPFSGRPQSYFIPRGHATVKGQTRARGYCHGGATPEEVIVDTAILTMAPAGVSVPSVRLLDAEAGPPSVFLRRMTTLRFQIRNPNASPLRVNQCLAPDAPGSVREVEEVIVSGHGIGDVGVTFYFQDTASTLKSLSLEFQGVVEGEVISFFFETEISFRSAQKGGLNLKDL